MQCLTGRLRAPLCMCGRFAGRYVHASFVCLVPKKVSVLGPLELELQAVMNEIMRVLGIEPRSSENAYPQNHLSFPLVFILEILVVHCP